MMIGMTMTTVTTKFQENYDKYVSTKQNLNLDSLRNEFREIMKSCFEANPEVVAIYIQGYTPSFNDGDVCRHRQGSLILTETSVSDPDYILDEEYLHFTLLSEDEDVSEEEKLEAFEFMGFGKSDIKFEWPETMTIDNISECHKDEILMIHTLINHLPHIKTLYDTNFMIKLTMKDGEVKLEKGDYWCGW